MLKSDNNAFYDVDDTLILWEYDKKTVDPNKLIELVCPDNSRVWVLPHFVHIENIRRAVARGHHIWIWSQGGWEWAELVVKKLGLQDYVPRERIICKPKWMFDDLPPEAWTKVMFLNPNKDNK